MVHSNNTAVSLAKAVYLIISIITLSWQHGSNTYCIAFRFGAFSSHTRRNQPLLPRSTSFVSTVGSERLQEGNNDIYNSKLFMSKESKSSELLTDSLPSLFPSKLDSDQDAAEASVDVLIVGAGPSGLLLASSLSRLGVTVGITDPAFNSPWPNNYGVWMDEAEHFGFDKECDLIWAEVGVIFDEDTPELILDRPYGRVDRKRLKARLVKECSESEQVKFAAARAVKLEHFDDAPSTVTLKTSRSSSKDKAGGELKVSATLVIDCSGFTRQFVEHDTPFDPGYQVTYGARVRVESHPYEINRMVLMDYSERHLYGDDELKKSNDRFPTFLYAQPISETEVFLEETVLVSRPAANSQNLQERMELRCKALNITVLEVLEDERAAIPMGGMDPVVPQRTLGFGATASLVHPASGYMVARAMEVAPRVAKVVAEEILALKRRKNNGQSTSSFRPGELDQVAAAGWGAVWPTDERRQRDFMHFGFELLCKLSPQELRDFFTGFFNLPLGLWEHFLSWRLSGIGHIYMGILVWASCIPRRFMIPMLIKSLPFLWPKLVYPAASRGDFEAFNLESVYYDARTEDSKVWEPERFYPYVKGLKDQILKDQQMVNNPLIGNGADSTELSSTSAMPKEPQVVNATMTE